MQVESCTMIFAYDEVSGSSVLYHVFIHKWICGKLYLGNTKQ